MRFLTLVAGTLLLTFLAFGIIRFWGQGQSYKRFQTAYFAKELPEGQREFILPWEQAQLLKDSSRAILWVDVYRASDENLLVAPWFDRNKANKDADPATNPARPLLKDLLSKFPQNRFVINCNQNADSIHRQLVQVIQEAKAVDRVLLQSDFNTILISAKELEPMMLYGSTPADLTRLKTFNSMWLLPAAPFKGDVFFVGLKYHGRETIDHDIVMELQRRFKKVFIGPLSTKEQVQQAIDLGADGLFVDDPFLMGQ